MSISMSDSKWKEWNDGHLDCKAASSEERLQKLKEHLKNLLGNSLKVTYKPTENLLIDC